MAELKDAKVIGIWGRRGSGKSTKAKELMRGYSRIVVYDPLLEYHKEGCRVVSDVRGMVQAIKRGWLRGFKIAYQPDLNANHVHELAEVSRILMRVQEPYHGGKTSHKILLVVEEASLSVPNQNRPEIRPFLNLCNVGRHWGIEIMGISQRIAEVHTTFRGNAAENYFFGQSGAADIQAATRLLDRQYATELSSLKTHEFLHLADGKVTRGRNRVKAKL